MMSYIPRLCRRFSAGAVLADEPIMLITFKIQAKKKYGTCIRLHEAG